MDNNKKDPSGIVNEWMDDIMKKLNIKDSNTEAPADDLGADEQAIAAAGLIHPDDMELEQIVQETLAENWGEPEKDPAVPTDEPTVFFTAPQSAAPQEVAPQEPVQQESVQPEAAPQEEQNKMDDRKKKRTASRKNEKKQKKEGFGLRDIPHIVSTVIWLFLIVAIGVTLGKTVWLCASDLLALGKESISVSITVEEDDTLDEVAEKLKEAGLIEYPKLFTMFTKLTGKCETMLRGTITFNEVRANDPDSGKLIYDYKALANALTYRGVNRVTVDVLIPEGYSCAQIFELLEKKGVCTVKELESYAATGELEGYWFLDGVERGHKYCLEGFLFPDTYEFYIGDEPGRVLQKFLNRFKSLFSQTLIDKYVALNNNTGLNLSIREVIIMASIVEKEKANDLEGYNIASVFYNRLKNPGTYPLLQSDATINYDTDYLHKGELTTDAQINASPYNTYTQKGLPPGPIANPGLSSIDAALDPEDTKYFYFIYDKANGFHRFSKTLSEHNYWYKKLGYK